MTAAAVFALVRALLRKIGRAWAIRSATNTAARAMAPENANPDRLVKITWAVGITATVLGELLFRCDGPLHPITALALKQANLAIICPPPPVVVPARVLQPAPGGGPSAVPPDQAPSR